MKPFVLVLVTSIAANAALLGVFAANPALAPSSVRGFFDLRPGSDPSASKSEAATARAARVRAPRSGQSASLWQRLHSPDLATLVNRLRAAGFPPTVLRAVVDAEVEARFASRIQELRRELDETPYWKAEPSGFAGNALYESVSQIYRERSQLLRGLLGQDAFAWGGVDPSAAQRRQFGDISPAKIDMVQRINDDYAEMIGQIRSASQGIMLPEDRDKLALLEREKRADLAAILTPAEMADYDMRTSPLTSRLRTPLSIMNASEAEFQAIFAIQQPYRDVLNPVAGMVGMDFMTQRREALQKINEQVKATLGEARFAEYERASTTEFQQLYRKGISEGISYDAMARSFDLRTTTAATSTAIMNDGNLSPAEKQTALKNLAQTTRTAVLSNLGPSVGPSYVESARWLSYLEQGGSFSVSPDGNLSFRRSALPTTATVAPKN